MVTSTLQNDSGFQLRDGEIHIWNAGLNVTDLFWQRRWQLLSAEERQRASRFLFERDRSRYVVARSTLRTLLGGYLRLSPEEITIGYGPNSKPELAPPLDRHMLHFNVSHSHGQLLVAIARGFAVGVDIEKVRPEMEIDAIAKRFFSSAEVEQLSALDNSTKCFGFFNGWTRKEAYLKARSEGIGYGLDQFTVALAPKQPARLLNDCRDPDAVQHWCVHELKAAPGYVAAVSAEALDSCVRQFAIPAIVSADIDGSVIKPDGATLRAA